MRKFEYMAVTRETLDEFQVAANRHGADGWELVGFQRIGLTLACSAMFKRELPMENAVGKVTINRKPLP